MQDGVLKTFRRLAIKFSLEKLGKPERELKRKQYDAIRENGLILEYPAANLHMTILFPRSKALRGYAN